MCSTFCEELNINTVENINANILKLHLTNKMECEHIMYKLENMHNVFEYKIKIIKQKVYDLETYLRIALSKRVYKPKNIDKMECCLYDELKILLTEQDTLLDKLTHILELEVIVKYTYEELHNIVSSEELQNIVTKLLSEKTQDVTNDILKKQPDCNVKRKANTSIDVITKKTKVD